MILTLPVHFLEGMMPARTLRRVVLPLPIQSQRDQDSRRGEKGRWKEKREERGRKEEERKVGKKEYNTRRSHDGEHLARFDDAAEAVEDGEVLLEQGSAREGKGIGRQGRRSS